MSPAAKMPETLVSRNASTTTPRSTRSPARSARSIRGRTPTPITTRSASSRVPSSRTTCRSSIAAGFRPRRKATPCASCSDRTKSAELGTEHPLQRPGVGRDDLDPEPALDQRRRDLEADEARADHDDGLGSLGRARDDRAAVGERPEREDVRLVGAGDRQPDRLGAGREQQPVEARSCGRRPARRAVAAVSRRGRGRRRAPAGCRAARRSSRTCRKTHCLGGLAGEEVLGEVRPVDRQLRIGGEQGHLAVESLAAQHLGRGEAGGATSDDDEAGASGRSRGAAPAAFGSFSRTTIRSPTISTRQQGTGSKAGARTASPVLRLKQAWCQGQRTVSPATIPSPSGPP